MPQPLRLELFAELTSRMASGETRSAVLESAKIDESHWDLSQQFWLAKMADDAKSSRFGVAQKYADLYKAAQARLAKAAALPPPPKPRELSKEIVVHAIPLPPPSVPGPPSAPGSAPGSGPGSAPGSAPRSSGPISYSARLSLEQLAALRAEILVSPEAQHAAIKQRFGLDEATWALEEGHWQRRLAKDDDLYKRYLRQFQYCRALLQRT
jgi:hypothetical protein